MDSDIINDGQYVVCITPTLDLTLNNCAGTWFAS